MAIPNYLGTQANLTGIPSLLLSTLGQVEDPNVQKALYQIQNWANSFFVWQYDIVSGSSYTSGGVAVTFDAPFASEVLAIAATAFSTSGASQARVAALTQAGVNITLYQPNGTQLGAGSPYEFSYIAIGH